MEILKHTQTEGKRTGIEINMNSGTGCPFGGPEVSIKDAASKAIFQTYQLEGGKEWIQDMTITDHKQQPYVILSRIMAYDEKGHCVNLTSFVKKNNLRWKAPSGTWKMIALYIRRIYPPANLSTAFANRQTLAVSERTTFQPPAGSRLETALRRKPAANEGHIRHRPPLFVDKHRPSVN